MSRPAHDTESPQYPSEVDPSANRRTASNMRASLAVERLAPNRLPELVGTADACVVAPTRCSGTDVPMRTARSGSRSRPSRYRPSHPDDTAPVLADPFIHVAIDVKWLRSGLGTATPRT